MNTQDFANYINHSQRSVQVKCGNFNFTFSTESDCVVFNVETEGVAIVTHRVDNEKSLLELANVMTMATRVEIPDENIAVYSNIVSVLRMLTNLIHNPVDYVLEEKYANFIKRVAAAEPDLEIKAGELITTFTYSDNMLHIKSLIPGKFCNTQHIGVEGDIVTIVDIIKDQYVKLDIQNSPSHPEIYHNLMTLGNDQ